VDGQKPLERWNVFQKKKNELVLSHAHELLIVIYGAYNPPSEDAHLGEKERLIELRDHLRKDGFICTYIVEDFPTNDTSCTPNLDKSLDCLEMADLNILIFTCRGKTGSVAREMFHALNSNILNKCKIFEEIDRGVPAMETLLREDLSMRRYNITKVNREDDEDLFEHVSSEVFQFLKIRIRFKSKGN